MKVIIIGAGAMGGLYGAFLSKKNQVDHGRYFSEGC